MFISFTLHTDPAASVPVFTISCQTRGGPPTYVQWSVNGTRIDEAVTDHSTSQIVLDTYSVEYESRLLVRSRTSGNYSCSITNNLKLFIKTLRPNTVTTVNSSIIITGKHKSSNNSYLLTYISQLQESPLISQLTSPHPIVLMSISLCLGLHHLIL